MTENGKTFWLVPLLRNSWNISSEFQSKKHLLKLVFGNAGWQLLIKMTESVRLEIVCPAVATACPNDVLQIFKRTRQVWPSSKLVKQRELEVRSAVKVITFWWISFQSRALLPLYSLRSPARAGCVCISWVWGRFSLSWPHWSAGMTWLYVSWRKKCHDHELPIMLKNYYSLQIKVSYCIWKVEYLRSRQLIDWAWNEGGLLI